MFWVILGVIILVLFFFTLGLIGFFWGTLFGAPFVPTAQKTVDEMVTLAGNIKDKKVYDLGCGDGRLVFTASEKGAIATGIEISFPVYLLAQMRKYYRILRKKKSGKILLGSLWSLDLREADIIFLYLLPKMMKRFEEEKIPTLKKRCLIISHGFALKNTKICKEIPRKNGNGKILVYEI